MTKPQTYFQTTELLWKGYFREPSLWCDNRILNNNERSPNLADFLHRATCEALWIDGWCNPCWVNEELERRTILFSRSEGLTGNHDMHRSNEHAKKDLTFVALLKDCAKKKDVCQGTKLHGDILGTGLLEHNPYLASALISMYAKCGVLSKAQKIHNELHKRSTVSWNALITGYVKQNQYYEALKCFEQMQRDGFCPNGVTFFSILKACGNTQSICKGRQIHDAIVNKGLLEKNIMLGTALIDMYAKCGLIAKARELFEDLSVQDIISWSALIGGYAQHGIGYEALKCLEQMKSEGICPDAVTFVYILKACGSIRAINEGKKIHVEIECGNLLRKNVVLGTALVNMYAKCGLLVKARKLHDELSERSVVSWNALIVGFTEQHYGHEALDCFEQMQNEGFSPDEGTFLCVLKACGKTGNIEKGKQIHDMISNRGLLAGNLTLSTALVDMYAKCEVLAKAKQVLDQILFRDVISWNSLIAGCAQQGQGHEALACYKRMQCECLFPDVVTFTCILKACGSIGAVGWGQQLHSVIIINRNLSEVLGMMLVDMYAKCGDLAKAHHIHLGLHVRTLASWNALIAGYAQHEQGHQALSCFAQMECEGLYPDVITYTCILKACGSAGAIGKGKEIHDELINQGLLEKNTILGTALVDMYCKCGMFLKASEVLHELPVRDIAAWNALLAGYAQHGQGREALDCFSQMLVEDLTPDAITLLCVLTACSHSGLLNEAEILYQDMEKKYSISPILEHYTCMLAIYGSSGDFDKIMSLMESMPSIHYPTAWLSVLGSCRKWGNLQLGILAFDQAVQAGSNSAAACVMMANIFAAVGMKEDAEKVEYMRFRSEAFKKSGSSVWVGATGIMHYFNAGCVKHSQYKDICQKMNEIDFRMLPEECSPMSSQIISSGQKGITVCGHTLKLAIACALINTFKGETIHISSNMSICDDCHIATSLISKLEKRTFIVNDFNCLHVFENGKCVCGN